LRLGRCQLGRCSKRKSLVVCSVLHISYRFLYRFCRNSICHAPRRGACRVERTRRPNRFKQTLQVRRHRVIAFYTQTSRRNIPLHDVTWFKSGIQHLFLQRAKQGSFDHPVHCPYIVVTLAMHPTHLEQLCTKFLCACIQYQEKVMHSSDCWNYSPLLASKSCDYDSVLPGRCTYPK